MRSKFLFAMAGFAYNLALAWLSLGMVGGGHGWTACIYAPMFGAVLCPILGVAIAIRGTPVGRALLIFVVLGAVVADGFMYYLTGQLDGWGHVFRMFPVRDLGWAIHDVGWLVAWIVFWFLWQVVAVGFVVQKWIASG